MKIAVYSGSFNPVHNGHLAVAKAALAEGYDEVWMVISPQNPHKNEEELWPFEDRLQMVKLAILNQPQLRVSDCENYLARPSYTIHTLKFLKKNNPQHQFRLLIGEDNLPNFYQWKDYQQIIANFGLIVYPRASAPEHPFEQSPDIFRISAPLLNISSSEIRKRLAENQSVSGLVPAEVEKYIFQRLKGYFYQ